MKVWVKMFWKRTPLYKSIIKLIDVNNENVDLRFEKIDRSIFDKSVNEFILLISCSDNEYKENVYHVIKWNKWGSFSGITYYLREFSEIKHTTEFGFIESNLLIKKIIKIIEVRRNKRIVKENELNKSNLNRTIECECK